MSVPFFQTVKVVWVSDSRGRDWWFWDIIVVSSKTLSNCDWFPRKMNSWHCSFRHLLVVDPKCPDNPSMSPYWSQPYILLAHLDGARSSAYSISSTEFWNSDLPIGTFQSAVRQSVRPAGSGEIYSLWGLLKSRRLKYLFKMKSSHGLPPNIKKDKIKLCHQQVYFLKFPFFFPRKMSFIS